MHFSQNVEDWIWNCKRLGRTRSRTHNSFSPFNPPQTVKFAKLVMSVLRILSVTVAKRAIGRCNKKFKVCSSVSQMNLSTGTSDESKFYPPHPTVMQRLIRIEDKLRFRGYSVLRIGLGILLVLCAPVDL